MEANLLDHDSMVKPWFLRIPVRCKQSVPNCTLVGPQGIIYIDIVKKSTNLPDFFFTIWQSCFLLVQPESGLSGCLQVTTTALGRFSQLDQLVTRDSAARNSRLCSMGSWEVTWSGDRRAAQLRNPAIKTLGGWKEQMKAAILRYPQISLIWDQSL